MLHNIEIHKAQNRTMGFVKSSLFKNDENKHLQYT